MSKDLYILNISHSLSQVRHYTVWSEHLVLEVKSYLANSSMDWETAFVVRHDLKVLFVPKQALPKNPEKIALAKNYRGRSFLFLTSVLEIECVSSTCQGSASLIWRVRVLEVKVQEKWKFQLPGVQVERHREGRLVSFFSEFKKERQVDHYSTGNFCKSICFSWNSVWFIIGYKVW